MNDYNNNLAALILIGGQSKRMGGGIKSFKTFNDKKLFDRILERIKPQINKIIINCNQKEKNLIKYKLPVIKDFKKGYLGPLAGIHAGLLWIKKNYPEVRWLITIPGDTPFIPTDLILKFKKKIIKKNYNIILAKSNCKIHPIIGAWDINLTNSLDDNLSKGTRKILTWAQQHSLSYIEYNYENYDPFFNINTREDLIKAQEIEKNLKKF